MRKIKLSDGNILFSVYIHISQWQWNAERLLLDRLERDCYLVHKLNITLSVIPNTIAQFLTGYFLLFPLILSKFKESKLDVYVGQQGKQHMVWHIQHLILQKYRCYFECSQFHKLSTKYSDHGLNCLTIDCLILWLIPTSYWTPKSLKR